MRERFLTEDFDSAFKHAARFGALEFKSVERILEARHQPRGLDEYIAAETERYLRDTLGTLATKRSDLTEYDTIHQPPERAAAMKSEQDRRDSDDDETQ